MRMVESVTNFLALDELELQLFPMLIEPQCVQACTATSNTFGKLNYCVVNSGLNAPVPLLLTLQSQA